jgi:HEAT repeat protein
MEMVYEPPPDFDRATTQRLLDSEGTQDQVSALHAATFGDPDDEWVLAPLLNKVTSDDPEVRYAAAAFTATYIGMGRPVAPETRPKLVQAKVRFPDLEAVVDDGLAELSNRGA